MIDPDQAIKITRRTREGGRLTILFLWVRGEGREDYFYRAPGQAWNRKAQRAGIYLKEG